MQTFNVNDSGETIRTKLNANAAEADTEDAANVKKDGSVAFTADQSMGGNQLTNVGEPGGAQDAATKNYVDTADATITAAITAAYTAAIAAAITAAKSAVHPVGSIYTNVTGVNPGTELGFGTWVSFGSGRVLVGHNGSDTDFDTVEEVGGEKTHTLTESEMPHHRHGIFTTSGDTTGAGSLPNRTNDGGSFDQYTDYSGNGESHNNLQPYIVVFFWKRTA